MDIYEQSNEHILKTLGLRLKRARLKSNITQESLAELTGLSITAIKNAEAGRSRLDSLIAILRELRLLDQIDHFIPESITISPLDLAKRQGKRRQRASERSNKKPSTDNSTNTDEQKPSW